MALVQPALERRASSAGARAVAGRMAGWFIRMISRLCFTSMRAKERPATSFLGLQVRQPRIRAQARQQAAHRLRRARQAQVDPSSASRTVPFTPRRGRGPAAPHAARRHRAGARTCRRKRSGLGSRQGFLARMSRGAHFLQSNHVRPPAPPHRILRRRRHQPHRRDREGRRGRRPAGAGHHRPEQPVRRHQVLQGGARRRRQAGDRLRADAAGPGRRPGGLSRAWCCWCRTTAATSTCASCWRAPGPATS